MLNTGFFNYKTMEKIYHFIILRSLALVMIAVNIQPAGAQMPERKFTKLDKVKYQIEYAQQAFPDSTDLSFVRGGIMLLLVGDSISLYQGRSHFIYDTVSRNFKSLKEAFEYINRPNSPHGSTLYTIYKNYPHGKTTTIEPIITDYYKYSEPLNVFNWRIESDTTVINTYKVQKATCRFGGRNWIAWFCADIPISDGPYKFCGLPGLIVKLNDTRNFYTYKLERISVPEKDLFIDMEEKNYIESSKAQFFEATKLLLENCMTILKEAGAESNTMQTAAQNISKNNNPIELDRE